MSAHRSTAFLNGAIALGTVILLSPTAIAQSPQGRSPETVESPSESFPAASENADSDLELEGDPGDGRSAIEADTNAEPLDANSTEPSLAEPSPTEPNATEPDAVEPDAATRDDVAPGAASDSATVDEVPADSSAGGSNDADLTNDAVTVDAPDADINPVETVDTDASDTTTTNTDAGDAADTDTDAVDADSQNAEAEAESEAESEAEAAAQQRRLDLFTEGDRLFEAEQYPEAEAVYRQAKGTFDGDTVQRAETITDPALLPPAGQVYWREYQAGLESGLDTRIDVPLQLLTQEHPEFIPGHLSYAERLNQQEQMDAALAVLERAATLYPNDQTLTQARIEALVGQEAWLQAAIAARQFALINPEHSAAPELRADAD
ncbi:MAG: hypothetical protein WBA10_12030, partial [Elainellaceae cyanobacterium]